MTNRWFTRRAISVHIGIVVFVPGFLALGWWQLHRALSGNGLSWAYAFEWPFFAAYAIYLWWKIVHDQDGHEKPARPPRAKNARADRRALNDARADLELGAYNQYLAALAKSDKQHDEERT